MLRVRLKTNLDKRWVPSNTNLLSDYRTNLLQIPLFWFSKEPLIKWLYRGKRKSVWLIELSNLKPTVRPQVYEDMQTAIKRVASSSSTF